MNKNLIVVDSIKDLNVNFQNAQLISADEYLLGNMAKELESARIFNLCNTLSYQGLGYYVSLLAMARRHRVIPDLVTIQDLKSTGIIKFYSEELDDLVEKKLSPIKSEEFELSIYFGQNIASKYNELAKKIFGMVKAPILKVHFEKDGKWSLKTIKLLSLKDVPDSHRDFFVESAEKFFSSGLMHRKQTRKTLYDVAILYNPQEKSPPSNIDAIQKFVKAGHKLGLGVDLITKEESSKIVQYDALFIRETTNVNHHTYRLARKAQAEGLIVIDDPESILKCTNKVFLEELLDRHDIPRPRSQVLNKENLKRHMKEITFPCILKQPDSAFSQGVHKANDKEEFLVLVEKLFKKSDLIIVQEFLPSEFDWRVGILGGEPLYACKYFMAKNHWQIINNVDEKISYNGDFESMHIKDVPSNVIKTALKVSNLVGKGLYGVDLKEVAGKVYIIEINDNPSIDVDVEDQILGDDLYLKIMNHFILLLNKQRKIGF